MNRQAVGAAILLAWGAGILLLVQRRGAGGTLVAGARPAAQPAVARISPTAAYYRLSLGDSTIGFALLTLDTSATAVEMVEQVDMRVPDGDSVRHVFQRTSSAFDRRLGFAGLDVVRREGPARWNVTGRRVSDSAFAWFLAEGTEILGDTLPSGGPPVASRAALSLAVLRARPPRVGDVRTVLMADPERRQVVPVEVTVVGESTAVIPDSAALDPVSRRWQPARWDTLRIWRLARRGAGTPTDMWVDEDGFPVIGDIVPGVRAERQPFEIATSAYRDAMAARFEGLGGRTGSRSATASPRASAQQRLLLQHVASDSAGWARSGLSGGAQQLAVDTLEVRRVSPDPAAGGEAAATVGGGSPPPSDTLALVAAAVVGSERDPRRVTERLVRWVGSAVAAGPGFGPANPLRALRQRRGGPSDRAALLVELARRRGLEARPVAGLVAVSGGGWARHAWAEIRLGEWVPADPSFGTFPAGAGYVRLLQDVAADPLYLVPLAAWLDPRRVPEKVR